MLIVKSVVGSVLADSTLALSRFFLSFNVVNSGLSLNQDKAEQCSTGLNLTHYVYDLGKILSG